MRSAPPPTANLIARKKARQHSGLIDGYGEPYPELQKAVRVCADEMYDIARSEARR